MALGKGNTAAATASAVPKGISFDPDTFTEGGLPIDDLDVEIADARFTYFNYGGKGKGDQLVLGVLFKDAEGKEHEQYYSAGDNKFFKPSDNGGTLEPLGEKAGLNKDTNVALFLASLVAVGFPKERLRMASITDALVGLQCHVNAVAQPKRPGLIKTGDNANAGSEDRVRSTVLVTRIIKLPGGGAVASKLGGSTGTGIGTAAGAADTTTSAAPDNELDTVTLEILIGILAETGGEVLKKDLPIRAFKAEAVQGHALKNKIISRIKEESFLKGAEGIAYDGSKISLA